MKRTITAALTVAIALALGGAASAHPVEGHIQDTEGDANLLNTQGFSGTVGDNPLDPGVNTAPASYGPADIRAVRFETPFEAILVGDDGIDYQATGVIISIVTEVDPRSDGPTFIYRLNVTVDGCSSFIQGFLQGNTPLPEDPAHRSIQWRQLDAGCPDGVRTVTMPFEATTDADENAIVYTFDYDDLTAGQANALREGASLFNPQGSVRTNFTWGSQGVLPFSSATAPQIDETVIGEEWIVGQDMPEDIPCTINCPGESAQQSG